MALEDFVARYQARHPSHFDVVIASACEARLDSLRCECLGVAAFRLLRSPSGDGERFERLISERLPATVFVEHGVESAQLPPAPADR
jgi:hypothetical protein